jgi:hypothetical protein
MVVYNVGSHQYVSFIDDKNINKQYKSCDKVWEEAWFNKSNTL